MNQIQVNELSKFYGHYKALDGVNVSFAQGKQYSIQGASGSGKSTLLYMLAGLENPPTEMSSLSDKTSLNSMMMSSLFTETNK